MTHGGGTSSGTRWMIRPAVPDDAAFLTEMPIAEPTRRGR